MHLPTRALAKPEVPELGSKFRIAARLTAFCLLDTPPIFVPSRSINEPQAPFAASRYQGSLLQRQYRIATAPPPCAPGATVGLSSVGGEIVAPCLGLACVGSCWRAAER